MVIKKFLLIIIIIPLLLSLSSCSSYNVATRDDKKIAETRLEEIIEALEKEDEEALKDMFSSNALKQANEIDSGIEYVMNFYEGKVISIEGSLESSDSKNNGEVKSELKGFYIVTTDKDEYIVFFIDQLVNTQNPDNVGLYMLQIIKLEDRDKYFDWGNETICAGIYRPDITEDK